MLERITYRNKVKDGLSRSPVVAILGPRQCGKTTLAKSVAQEHAQAHFFDLESPQDTQRLINAETVLGSLDGLIVLDEIQRMPELFNILRVLADRDTTKTRFIVLGNASPTLIKHASESLAGRVEFVDLHGFDISEVDSEATDSLWYRGGFPRSFLASNDEDSVVWREGFVRTYLERDLPQLGIRIPSQALRRFWTMLAHSQGQIWNASKLSVSMGLSDKTVRSYLDILSDTYMVRQLQPWHENVKKRQVKAPKLYLRDSGLLHHLLSLDSLGDVHSHPILGASWEGFAMEQVLRTGNFRDAYFWSVHSGPELDLLGFRHGKRLGFEFKVSATPTITHSMKQSMKYLHLDALFIVCPTRHAYPLDDAVTVCAPHHLHDVL